MKQKKRIKILKKIVKGMQEDVDKAIAAAKEASAQAEKAVVRSREAKQAAKKAGERLDKVRRTASDPVSEETTVCGTVVDEDWTRTTSEPFTSS